MSAGTGSAVPGRGLRPRTAADVRPAGSERITVALIPKAGEDLQHLQDRTGLSKTDIVNRAISLYEFVDTELAAGAEMIIRRDGQDYLIKLM